MSLEVAIARLEEKQDAQTAMMERFIEAQDGHNARFYATSKEVTKMQSNARGAWWMLGVLGTMVSATVAGVVSYFK